MRCLKILVALSVLFPASVHGVTCSGTIAQGTTESCDVVVQYGITWTLSANETVGQFVTGDYFIVHDGSVVVSSVSPPNIAGINGSQVNPKQNIPLYGGSKYRTAFITVASYTDTGLNVAFPLTMTGGQSLVSTIAQSGAGTSWTGDIEDDSELYSAAVLTVLSSQPASGAFRPGYCGDTKAIYNTSQIDTGVLQNLSTSGIALPTHAGFTTVEYYERGMERPWILSVYNWQGRQAHPIQNMLDYHEHIGSFLGEAMLLLHSDQRTNELLYNFIQVGIDTYAMAINGDGDSAYFGQVVALTAAILDDTAMKTAYPNGNIISVSRERDNFYAGTGWTGATALFRKDANEYEETALNTWVDDPDCKDETYRDGEDSKPQIGTNLSIMLSGSRATDALGYQVILDYADRFMTEEFATLYLPAVQAQCPSRTFGGYQSSGSTFTDQMWAAYRDTVGDQGPHSRGTVLLGQ